MKQIIIKLFYEKLVSTLNSTEATFSVTKRKFMRLNLKRLTVVKAENYNLLLFFSSF